MRSTIRPWPDSQADRDLWERKRKGPTQVKGGARGRVWRIVGTGAAREELGSRGGHWEDYQGEGIWMEKYPIWETQYNTTDSSPGGRN